MARHDVKLWIEQDDLHPADDWRPEIEAAILDAQAFLYVISEDSGVSPHSRTKLRFAVTHRKCLIPLVTDQTQPSDKRMPNPLADLHWIFCRDEGQFEPAMSSAGGAADDSPQPGQSRT